MNGNRWMASGSSNQDHSSMGLTDIQKKVGTLSGGQKKRVGLYKVMEEPDLLLLDEPTNHLNLGYRMVRRIFGQLQRHDDARDSTVTS